MSFTRSFFLTPGECNAQGTISVPLIASRLIEIATAHANILEIGYTTLKKHNIGWVLVRLSIEMLSYPGINSTYSVTTWIESINKRFSERNFLIADSEGNPIGYARSVWAAIDFNRRTGADLSILDLDSLPVGDLKCPMAKTPRIPPLRPGYDSGSYRFRYCDIDFNRHVNTVRYLELLMDAWDMDFYDSHTLRRVDLLFANECRCGEEVMVRKSETADDPLAFDCEIVRDDMRMIGARFVWN